MFQDENDYENDLDLGGNEQQSTITTGARYLGYVVLVTLLGYTAWHAINVASYVTGSDFQVTPSFVASTIGVVLMEAVAAVTAVLFITGGLRAKQKPIGLLIEITWAVFATLNLITSFAIEGGVVPSWADTWAHYGLPVSGLIGSALFYVMLRNDPNAKRKDDHLELWEKFRETQHKAKLEVMSSPQMKTVMRQAMWEQLPPILARQFNLSQRQVQALIRQAPELLDLNQNGQPDALEPGMQQSANGQVSETDINRLLAALSAYDDAPTFDESESGVLERIRRTVANNGARRPM